MQGMHRTLVIFAAVAVALVIPISAQAQADYGRPGWYLGAGASWALFTELTGVIEDSLSVPLVSEIDANVSSPFGFNARAGYRLMSHFGTELQFEYLPYVSVKVSDLLINGDPKTQRSEFDFWTLTANGKAYISDGRIQPFGLLGLGMGYTRVKGLVDALGTHSEVGFALRVGGGVDAYATENVAIGFDVTYVLPFGDINDFDYLSLILGVKYRF
ncbi:MAG: porin family protein [Deltaproteobacteria bacterium]|nr:porin family protein [Deltaproteobacteria bacterium]